MRSKEDAQDYRYFPEPDILTVEVSDEFVDAIRSAMPELPTALRKRYVEKYGLGETEADLIVKYKKIADFFNDCARQANPKLAANLILGQIFRGMQTEEEKEAFGIKVTPSQLAELVKLQDEGKINAQIARQTLKKMLEEGKDASAYLTEDDLKGVDSGAIDKLCAEAVAANARAVNDYRNGKTQAIKALVGYVMKATRGKADAGEAEKKIIALIGG